MRAFGWAVAGLGDVNADGTPDFIVGAPSSHVWFEWRRDDAHGTCLEDVERGSAWVISGKTFTVLLSWYGDAEGSCFGYSVGAAGDVNRDGHADILVGAPGNASIPGMVRVYSGQDGHALITLISGQVGDGFGASIRARYSSGAIFIAVGAPEDEGVGSVWTFTGPNYEGRRARVGSVREGHFGAALDLTADLDGDGVLEVVVGAPGSEADRTGAVFVLSGLEGEILAEFVDPAPPSSFGSAVRTLRDIDGHGTPGIAVGAPWYGPSPEFGGAVIELALEKGELGHRLTAPSSNLQLDEFRCREESEYGHALAALGDLDGDGIDDLLVGAPKGFWCGGDVGWAQVGASKAGGALHFLNFEGEAFEGEKWTPFEFGFAVDCVGDLDGDGVVDLLIGAPDLWIWGGGVQVASGATGKVIKEILAETVAKEKRK